MSACPTLNHLQSDTYRSALVDKNDALPIVVIFVCHLLRLCLTLGHGHASGAEVLAQQELNGGVSASDATPAYNDSGDVVANTTTYSTTILQILVAAALIGAVYYAARAIAKISNNATFQGVVLAVTVIGAQVGLAVIIVGALYHIPAHQPQTVAPVPVKPFVTDFKDCGDWTDSNGRLYQYCVFSQNSGPGRGCTIAEASNVSQAIIDTLNNNDPNGAEYLRKLIEHTRSRRTYVRYVRHDSSFYRYNMQCP